MTARAEAEASTHETLGPPRAALSPPLPEPEPLPLPEPELEPEPEEPVCWLRDRAKSESSANPMDRGSARKTV
jgi:hypothetical protein